MENERENEEQEIRELAYSKWEEAGYPPGDGVNFWLDAENEVKSVVNNNNISLNAGKPVAAAAKRSVK